MGRELTLEIFLKPRLLGTNIGSSRGSGREIEGILLRNPRRDPVRHSIR